MLKNQITGSRSPYGYSGCYTLAIVHIDAFRNNWRVSSSKPIYRNNLVQIDLSKVKITKKLLLKLILNKNGGLALLEVG